MSFRSRPGRDCWHFCENCPTWPWDCDAFETDDDPPRERWCKTCVRMYEAGTGDLEWPQPGPTPSPVFVAPAMRGRPRSSSSGARKRLIASRSRASSRHWTA